MTEVERTCKYCGRRFYAKQSRVDKGAAKYCSTVCYGKARSNLIRGNSHPLWKEKIEIICQFCGKRFEVKPSLAKSTKYCSQECRGKGRLLNYKRENHPNWNGGLIIKNCGVCGKEFEVKPSMIKLGRGKYCSKECRYKAHSKKMHKKMKGKNNPNFSVQQMRGKNNPKWKRVECICQFCGKQFVARNSQIVHGYGKFCSRSCSLKSLNMIGENHPSWKGTAEIRTCEQCGNQFTLHKNLTNPDKKGAGRFCSKKCMSEWLSINKAGQSAVNWKGGPISTECGTCGKKIDIPRYRIEKADSGIVFCSANCFHKWSSKNIRGEKHFAWKDGASYKPYCEKFDRDLKERVRAFFDRKCILCGTEEKDLHEKLIVHHVFTEKMACCESKIIEMDELRKRLPLNVAQFGEPVFSELEIIYIRMMIPLCRSCHGKSHGKSKIDKYRRHFSSIIMEEYGGKCYYSKDEFLSSKVESTS